jgi:hypothetical protein
MCSVGSDGSAECNENARSGSNPEFVGFLIFGILGKKKKTKFETKFLRHHWKLGF